MDAGRRRADRASGNHRRDTGDRPVQLFGAGRRLSLDQHHHDLQRHGHRAQPVVEPLLATAGPVQGLEKITPASDNSGVILSLGDAGATASGLPAILAWAGRTRLRLATFRRSPRPAPAIRTVLPDGTQITFNSGGYETATIDLNNQHITYSYNGSNQLTTITDNYNNNTTLTYSGSDLSTIKDPAGRLTTFTFSGSDLAAVQQADGTHISYTYDSAGRLTQVKDPLSNAVTVSYDSAERVGTITRPDLTTEEFSRLPGARLQHLGHLGEPGADGAIGHVGRELHRPESEHDDRAARLVRPGHDGHLDRRHGQLRNL